MKGPDNQFIGAFALSEKFGRNVFYIFVKRKKKTTMKKNINIQLGVWIYADR